MLWLCALILCVNVTISIVNETPYYLEYQQCEKIGQWVTQPSDEGFSIESLLMTRGKCLYTMNNVSMDLFWNYDTIHNSEYYGVENVLDVQPWIRIQSPGNAIIYLRN